MKRIKIFCTITLTVILFLSCLAGCQKKTENIPTAPEQPTDTAQNEETADTEDTEPEVFDDIGDGLGTLFTYEYDEDGNKTKEVRYNNHGNAISWQRVYEYDSKGNMIKSTTLDSDGALKDYYIYEYDESGSTTKDTGYRSDGSVWIQEVYEYYENTKQIKIVYYDTDGNVEDYSESQRIYNSDGKLLEIRNFDENGNVRYIKENKYDEYGNMIEEKYLYIKDNSEESVYYSWAEATPAQYRFYIKGIENYWHTIGDVFY